MLPLDKRMFGLAGNLFRGHQKPRKTSFRPQFEALEKRDTPSVSTLLHSVAITSGTLTLYIPPQPTAAGLALINGLPATPVRTTALADYQRDGFISRNDMMDILNKG